MKILILCTGNSCRSQMAHGILQAFDDTLHVRSAGTDPAPRVHPNALRAMDELGLDIRHHQPVHVEEYLPEEWDFVITVCGGANESCPVFTGKVKQRLHIGFEDPALAQGSDEEIMKFFRSIRDEILRDFFTFYQKNLRK
ncbi:MAG: arsenate reductase ArsC [Bacteroidia bacterium]|nr:arsenate reductase ArsC [Bacteroidia bacterium]